MIEEPIVVVAIVGVALAITLLAVSLIHWSERAPGGGLALMAGRATSSLEVAEFLDRV